MPFPSLAPGRLKKVRINGRPSILDTETNKVSPFWADQASSRDSYLWLLMNGTYPLSRLTWINNHADVQADYDDYEEYEEDYYDDDDEEY